MKKYIFLLVFPLLAFSTAHKFYVSVTNVNYSEKDDALQITTRLFIDDLEALLKARYDIDAQLATKDELPMSDGYIEKYLKIKFVLRINGEIVPYTLLGKKYDNDVVICYLEAENVHFNGAKSIEFENEILTDLYDEQKNLMHFKFKGKKKSFVLTKWDTKGMLNL